MEIEYDPAKNERNIRERGLSFKRAGEFEFATAEIHSVVRYGETRLLATGRIGSLTYFLVFKGTDRGIRVISLRRANRREVRRYEEGRRNLE